VAGRRSFGYARGTALPKDAEFRRFQADISIRGVVPRSRGEGKPDRRPDHWPLWPAEDRPCDPQVKAALNVVRSSRRSVQSRFIPRLPTSAIAKARGASTVEGGRVSDVVSGGRTQWEEAGSACKAAVHFRLDGGVVGSLGSGHIGLTADRGCM